MRSANRTLLLVSGGAQADDEAMLDKAQLSMDAGATGLIFGRNVWQREHRESLAFVARLQEILAKHRVGRPAAVNADRSDGSRRIVVGVDGSPSSKAALRWAICQAELSGAVVEAVTAWWYPSGFGLAGAPGDAADSADDAEKTLTVALGEVSGLDPAVVVRPRIIQGHPAEVLVREAARADLLVVGGCGHGGLLATVLGSVSQHCAQQAPCPVLVMRDLGSQGHRVTSPGHLLTGGDLHPPPGVALLGLERDLDGQEQSGRPGTGAVRHGRHPGGCGRYLPG